MLSIVVIAEADEMLQKVSKKDRMETEKNKEEEKDEAEDAAGDDDEAE